MGADLSIYSNLLAQPKSALDYADEFAKRKGNALALKQQQQAFDDDKAYRDASAGFGSDVQSNYQALLKARLPSQANAYLKQAMEGRKTQSEIDLNGAKVGAENAKASKDSYSVQKEKYTQGMQILTAAATPQDAVQRISDGVAKGYWSMHDAQQKIAEVPQDPQQYMQWRRQELDGLMNAHDRMTLEQTAARDAEATRHNKAGEAATIRGQDVSAATTRRGQDMVDARTRERLSFDKEQPKGQIVQTDGGPVLVDPRTGQGRPVVGPDGKPMAGQTKPLNDSQSKALLFGSRMRDAHAILDQMSGAGVDQPGLIKRAGESIPLVGDGVGSLLNFTQSPGQQSVEQAQRDFVNAVLRRESGASISPSEFDSAKRQYFPQIGDSDQVKTQKRKNRELAINGMLQEVPEGQRNSIGGKQAKPATNDIHAQAEAILKGK